MSEFDSRRFPVQPQAIQETTPKVPGKTTLTEGTLPRTTRELSSHTDRKSIFRTPEDEQTLDWTKLVKATAPPTPFIVEPLVPPFACPMPLNSVREGRPSYATHDDAPVLITDSRFQWRQRCWETYAGAATYVEKMLAAVAPDLQRFQYPEHDTELRALGFVLPAGYQGDLNVLAGLQHVPNRGGPEVDSLFRGNEARLLPSDHDAIVKVNTSGCAESGFLGVIGADAALRAALHRVHAKASNVIASNDALKAAQARIAAVQATKEVRAAEAEIAMLKEESQRLTEAVEFIDTGPAKVVELVEQGLEDISHVGSICALVLRTFPVAGLEAAERRLAVARFELEYATTEALARDLAAAKHHSLATLHELAEAHEELAGAMTARRQAYNEAARQVGNQKLGAMVSAIPVAETVVASLRHLTEATRNARPPCSREGAVGFGIAVAHGYRCAFQLSPAIGWLEFINTYFGLLYGDWAEKLQSLRGVRDQLASARPQGDIS